MYGFIRLFVLQNSKNLSYFEAPKPIQTVSYCIYVSISWFNMSRVPTWRDPKFVQKVLFVSWIGGMMPMAYVNKTKSLVALFQEHNMFFSYCLCENMWMHKSGVFVSPQFSDSLTANWSLI